MESLFSRFMATRLGASWFGDEGLGRDERRRKSRLVRTSKLVMLLGWFLVDGEESGHRYWYPNLRSFDGFLEGKCLEGGALTRRSKGLVMP